MPSRSAMPPPRRAVQADRVDLVEIGHGVVRVGDVAEFGDRRDVAVHRIDGLEGDELRRCGSRSRELAVEVARVVVREDALLGAAVPDALDHRGVVERIGEDDAARHARRQRAERRPVRDVARGEQQRGFLAVQVGELAAPAARDSGWCRRCCGCRRRRRRTVDRLVHRRRAPRGAGPCRDNRSSTRPSPRRRRRGGDGWRAGIRRHGARDRRRRGSGLPVQPVELPAEKSFVVHERPPVDRGDGLALQRLTRRICVLSESAAGTDLRAAVGQRAAAGDFGGRRVGRTLDGRRAWARFWASICGRRWRPRAKLRPHAPSPQRDGGQRQQQEPVLQDAERKERRRPASSPTIERRRGDRGQRWIMMTERGGRQRHGHREEGSSTGFRTK